MLKGLTADQVAVLTSPNREIKLFAAVGVGIDQTSADDLSLDPDELMSIANTHQSTNAIYEINRIAVFEGAGMSVASGQSWVCPDMDPKTDTYPETAIWLDGISDDNGNINDTLTLSFGGKVHNSSLTLYFDEMCIPSDFTIKFYTGTTLNKTHTATGNTKVAYNVIESDTPIITDYDKIVINFTKIPRPRAHVRIAEIEFGASYTVGSEYISAGTSVLYTYDPMGLTQSPDELDLSYINIGGIFDTDNPSGTWRAFDKENSITLTMTARAMVNGRMLQVSAPMGRFYIVDAYVTGGTFNVTAMDCRVLMQDVAPAVTFSAGTSIGTTIKNLLKTYGIGSVVDDSINAVQFQKDVTFNGDVDLLTITQYVIQYADVLIDGDRIEMYIDRHGTLTFGPRTRDAYGNIPSVVQYDHPFVDTYDSYNMLSVKYGDQYYTPARDLNVPEEHIAIENPFIETLAQATILANHVIQGMMTSCKSTTMVGDLRMDPSDYVRMQSRFTTAENAPLMVVTEMEYTYTGSLKCAVKGCTGGWQ